jgi:polyketide synthase PksN
LIVIHHLIFDGSSTFPFITGLLNAYQDLVHGRHPEPIAQATGYHDFVEWEQNMLKSKEGEAHLAYWKQQLSGPLPILELPTDRARSSAQSFKGQVYTCLLAPELSGQLKLFSQFHKVSLSVVFLGIYQGLLYRYTGQEDIIIGMPTIGRPQPRFETPIGYFVNMIAVRSQKVGTGSFTQFIKELQPWIMRNILFLLWYGS